MGVDRGRRGVEREKERGVREGERERERRGLGT